MKNWENTSGNDAIQAFFDMPDINVSDKFETLLNGGIIYQTVTNVLTYEEAYSSEENLWSIILMTALWNGDAETATEILSDLLWTTISYIDYSEDYYHAFLTGIFVSRGGYSVRSNKEQGLGRPDIDLRDRKNRRAMIIEAKISESERWMDYWCDYALKQINEKGYASGLDGYRQVLKYGISFYKKRALVKNG